MPYSKHGSAMAQVATGQLLTSTITVQLALGVSYASVLTSASAFMAWDQRGTGANITTRVTLFLHLIAGHLADRRARA